MDADTRCYPAPAARRRQNRGGSAWVRWSGYPERWLRARGPAPSQPGLAQEACQPTGQDASGPIERTALQASGLSPQASVLDRIVYMYTISDKLDRVNLIYRCTGI